MTENLENKAVEMIGKLESLTAELAPKVVDAALTITSLDAASGLLGSLICLLVAIAALYAPRKWLKDGLAKYDDLPYLMYAIFAGLLLLGASVAFACNWFSLWTWVAIFNPELAIAHRVFG